MIFPETKDKSNVVVRTAGKLWNILTGASSESGHPRFNVPSTTDMRKMCLEIHLQSSRKVILEGNHSEKFEIKDAFEGCFSLWYSCFMQYVEYKGNIRDWNIEDVKTVSVIINYCYLILL